MKQKNLIALAVVTALVVVATFVVYGKRSDASAAQSAASAPLLEGLATRLNDVALLEITRDGKSVAIEKLGADWTVRSASGYPADFETVKKSLIALADLEIAEPKTSDPERYSELGVEDPDEEGAESTLVVLKDQGGAVLASLVVGDAKPGRSPELYVRKSDDARAWKVKGQLDLRSDAKTWMEREVANVASDRTREVTITHADGERLHVHKAQRSDANFTVDDVPADRELLSPTIGNSLASVLSFLTFDEVRPAAEIDFESAPIATAEIRTWDGLVVEATVADHEGVEWVHLRARYEAPPAPEPREEGDSAAEGGEGEPDAEETAEADEPAPDAAAIRAEAQELDADLAPWAFLFPSYKQSNLKKRVTDLLRTPPPAPVADDGVLPAEPSVDPDAAGGAGTDADADEPGDGSPSDETDEGHEGHVHGSDEEPLDHDHDHDHADDGGGR